LAELSGRVEAVGTALGRRPGDTRRATSVAMALVVGVMAIAEARFYFFEYAAMDRWSSPTREGQAVARQGTDTLVMTMGRAFHVVNSGWVRLLAPFTPRGGLESPGSELPLALPPEHDVAFMVMRNQPYYLPFVRAI